MCVCKRYTPHRKVGRFVKHIGNRLVMRAPHQSIAGHSVLATQFKQTRDHRGGCHHHAGLSGFACSQALPSVGGPIDIEALIQIERLHDSAKLAKTLDERRAGRTTLQHEKCLTRPYEPFPLLLRCEFGQKTLRIGSLLIPGTQYRAGRHQRRGVCVMGKEMLRDRIRCSATDRSQPDPRIIQTRQPAIFHQGGKGLDTGGAGHDQPGRELTAR